MIMYLIILQYVSSCRLVKRGLPLPPGLKKWCKNEGENCWDFRCCSGLNCVDLTCKSCNQRKCKNTRDCCNDLAAFMETASHVTREHVK